MAFGIPVDLPSIPSLTGIISLPVPGVSVASKAVITALTGQSRSSLFSNPMTGAITTVGTNVTSLQTTLTSISTGSVINSSITSGDATTFLAGTGISNLSSSLSSLTAHTNRLSGVLAGSGISTPGLEQITSISRQMNNMANLIDGASGCTSVIGAATGLFSQAEIGQIGQSLASAIAQIDNGVTTIAKITDIVVNTKTLVDNIVSRDNNFLGQCVEQLKQAAFGMALTSAMGDPCTKFILEQTGVPSFLTQLRLPAAASPGGR